MTEFQPLSADKNAVHTNVSAIPVHMIFRHSNGHVIDLVLFYYRADERYLWHGHVTVEDLQIHGFDKSDVSFLQHDGAFPRSDEFTFLFRIMTVDCHLKWRLKKILLKDLGKTPESCYRSRRSSTCISKSVGPRNAKLYRHPCRPPSIAWEMTSLATSGWKLLWKNVENAISDDYVKFFGNVLTQYH